MNKVVEYMAMGRPVVSFDLVETRVSAGDAAVYVAANDELAFAKAIDALLQDPERRRQMGELGAAGSNRSFPGRCRVGRSFGSMNNCSARTPRASQWCTFAEHRERDLREVG